MAYFVELLMCHVAELAAQKLPCNGLWHFVKELNLPRILVIRHALLAKLDQFLWFDLPLVAAFDSYIGFDGFTPVRIWYTDHGSFAHGWMLVESILYVTRPHLVARNDDHILLTVNDVEPTLLIHLCDITCVQVTITNGMRRFFWLLPVASDNLWPPGNQLAYLASWKVFACSHIDHTTDRVRD